MATITDKKQNLGGAQPSEPGIASPDLLRFTTAGSVDDGKSTLIGRLLHDADALHDDHVEALQKRAGGLGGNIDFSLITDGLKAEREQGITIDVAYRYFSTPRRRFIIADTPGHEQYTRNMATGASTADVAVILIDARQGILRQSKRHGFISSLLGVPRIIVAVNKMDLVGYDENVFRTIRDGYAAFAAPLGFVDVNFIPISALAGDNVVHHSTRMPWYDGPTLLSYLENVFIGSDANVADFRFPVQRVVRPDQDFRGYAGTVASGTVRVGDEIVALPSGKRSRVSRIVTMDGDLPSASGSTAVTICLEDDIDVSRGDMIVHLGNMPHVRNSLDAMLVWMSAEKLKANQSYVLKHTTHQVKALCSDIVYKVDPDTTEHLEAAELGLNDIARVQLQLFRPIFFDEYRKNRRTGSFILIDPISNVTVAGGMILPAALDAVGTARVPTDALTGSPATIWVSGSNSASPAEFSRDLAARLRALGQFAAVIDSRSLAAGLNSDLADGAKEGEEGVRRVAEVARMVNDAGVFVIVALDNPDPGIHAGLQRIVGADRLITTSLAAGTTEAGVNELMENLAPRFQSRPEGKG